MEPLLDVVRASKSFDGLEANRDISLRVGPREIVGLIGPNGSGKTVLFESITGQHPMDGGRIRFGGDDITGLTTGEIARRGLVRLFQQTQVFGKMSCAENMRVSAAEGTGRLVDLLRPYPTAVDARAEDLLELVGLHAKRRARAHELSFGQQKMLELAMGLMNEPSMLLLDEPSAGINPALVDGVVDLVRRVNREFGVTFLVIEHDMRVIMGLADRIYCIARGEVLAEGPPSAIRDDPSVVRSYLGDPAVRRDRRVRTKRPS